MKVNALTLCLALTPLAPAAACRAPEYAPVPPVTSATPGPETQPPLASSSASPAAPSASSYVGHGAETIAPDVLEKYRPLPLPAAASSR